jgi:hypothetical protein
MAAATVVVLTEQLDATADHVIERLNAAGSPVARMDLAGLTVDAELLSGSVPLDWRVDHAANQWYRVDVPEQVRLGLGALLRRTGLRFVSADFTVDQAGDWWFLDLNPAGQWAWDHPERTNVVAALVDALSGRGMVVPA